MSSKPRKLAALLNTDRLDFDKRLTFGPLEAVVDVKRYGASEPKQVVERARGCHILISKEMPLGEDVLQRLPDTVELICEAGTGFDNIHLAAAKQKSILVCNVPCYSTRSVAKLAMRFILTLSSRTHGLIRTSETRELADYGDGLRPSDWGVQGKILGVVGAGAIGQRVIRAARVFNMTVLVHNRSKRTWRDGMIKRVGLEELLKKSNFVSLHLPYEEGTAPLIRSETIGLMEQRPYLVNTARGRLVNHADLVEALESGQIAGAALDVQDPEPLPDDHPLWSMENVILTPHIGWKPLKTRRRLVENVAENIRAFLRREPVNVVN